MKKGLVTRRELAKRLGKNPQTLSKWLEEGLPVAQRGRGGRPSLFDEAAARAWVKARETVAPGSTSFQQYHEAHARQRQAQAALAEFQLEERRGKYIDAELVKQRLADVFTRCRTKLLAVPSKAKLTLPHLTHTDVLALDALVREALEELAA